LSYTIKDDSEIIVFNVIECTVKELLDSHPKADFVHELDDFLFLVHSVEDSQYSTQLVTNNKIYLEELFFARISKSITKIMNAQNLEVFRSKVSPKHKFFKRLVEIARKTEAVNAGT